MNYLLMKISIILQVGIVKNMKKYLTQTTFLIILGVLILPQTIFAAWWNPFSWSWFAPKVLQTPPISDYRANTVASTSIDTIQKPRSPEPVSPKAVTPIIPKKDPPVATSSVSSKNIEPTDPKALLVAKFLKDPTLENFKIFCNEAKNIEGDSTKQVLSSDRQTLITVKLTLYDDIRDCQDLLDPLTTSRIYFRPAMSYIPLNDNLLIPFTNSDQDWLREAKILYNNEIKNLIKISVAKFIRFNLMSIGVSGGVSNKESIKLPTDLFKYLEDRISTTQQSIDTLNQNYPNMSEVQREMTIKNYRATIDGAKKTIRGISGTVSDLNGNITMWKRF